MPSNVLVLFAAQSYDEKYKLSPKKIYVDDEWNPVTKQFRGDLSLLEFKKGSIRLNYYVEPICMFDPEKEPEGIGKVASWKENSANNYENGPHIVTAFIESEKECFSANNVQANSSDLRFCATAGGDSGGGFYIETRRNHFLLAGVESSSLACLNCDKNETTIYTKIAIFRAWIEYIVQGSPKIQS